MTQQQIASQAQSPTQGTHLNQNSSLMEPTSCQDQLGASQHLEVPNGLTPCPMRMPTQAHHVPNIDPGLMAM